jgi:putative Mg2+ transporter-C (MgtC) family protein
MRRHTLGILLMMSRVERFIGKLQRQKMLSVTFRNAEFSKIQELEDRLNSDDLIIERLRVSKDQDTLTVVWLVSGKKQFLLQRNETLAAIPDIISFS